VSAGGPGGRRHLTGVDDAGTGDAGLDGPGLDDPGSGDAGSDDESEAVGAGKRPRRGDPAPTFCLEGTGGHRYDLADYRGEPVVLVFYPADHSPVCTQQLRSYSDDLGPLAALGAQVLCLSPQDVATHEEFVAAHDLRLPLLADLGKVVGQAYNILGPLGFYRRSVFVVDAAGIVRFARRSLTSMTFMPASQLIEVVRSAT
jgi:peroxiredoxin Q/BCP